MVRSRSYFVADVHLGLDLNDPKDREARFVSFLRSIPAEQTENLFLLGDIWDFWYEYRDVVPKGYVGVFSAIQDLISAGVNVYFFRGNHDVWSYSYFEELGMRPLEQPYVVDLGGKTFCIGHGDGLGPGDYGYKFLRSIFHCRFLQILFSALHPWLAFRLGCNWSRSSRIKHRRPSAKAFCIEGSPLQKFAEKFSSERKVDYFIFGHFHSDVDVRLSTGARLLVLGDWLDKSPYFLFDFLATPDLISVLDGYSQNRE